jgi:hypothetical protein
MNPQNPQMKINLAEHGKPVKCEKCECETFQDVVYLFKISKLITGGPQDTLVPMPSFKCTACGHINAEFTPNKGVEKKPKLDI